MSEWLPDEIDRDALRKRILALAARIENLPEEDLWAVTNVMNVLESSLDAPGAD